MTEAIKQYTVKNTLGDTEVTLEVDHAKLTHERAEMHLRFWTSADEYIEEENGDSVRAAIRSFGVDAMYHMLGDLGASFTGGFMADKWSKKMRVMEGYGGEDGTPHGWLGIRIIAAQVQSPSFEEVELSTM